MAHASDYCALLLQNLEDAGYGNETIQSCMSQFLRNTTKDGCDFCHNGGNGRCVHEDMVNDWLEKAAEADGFVFGSPVYYAHPTGQFLSLLDRMFYAGGEYLQFKPGAAVVTDRFRKGYRLCGTLDITWRGF